MTSESDRTEPVPGTPQQAATPQPPPTARPADEQPSAVHTPPPGGYAPPWPGVPAPAPARSGPGWRGWRPGRLALLITVLALVGACVFGAAGFAIGVAVSHGGFGGGRVSHSRPGPGWGNQRGPGGQYRGPGRFGGPRMNPQRPGPAQGVPAPVAPSASATG